MLAKTHSNTSKRQVTQQKYYNMRSFNSPFSLGDKVVKKNMADESYNANMTTQWRGPYTIVEVIFCIFWYILKSNFPARQVKWFYQEVPVANDDEDPPYQVLIPVQW